MNESRLFGRLLLRFNAKGEAIPEEDDSVLVLFNGPSAQRRCKKTSVFADMFTIDAE